MANPAFRPLRQGPYRTALSHQCAGFPQHPV